MPTGFQVFNLVTGLLTTCSIPGSAPSQSNCSHQEDTQKPLLQETILLLDHGQLTQIITANTASPHGGPCCAKFGRLEAVFNMESGSLSEQKILGQGHRE